MTFTLRYILLSSFLFTSIYCQDVVRLTNIVQDGDNIEGEVEVYYKDLWRPLCAREWWKENADVICRTIGFQQGAAATKRNWLMGEKKRRNYYYLFLGFLCKGNEDSIDKCSNWNVGVMNMKTCSEGIAIAECKR